MAGEPEASIEQDLPAAPPELSGAWTGPAIGPAPDAKVDLRKLPSLARTGLKLIWAAGRSELLLLLALQLISGACIAALLVVGRRALDTLLAAVNDGAGLPALLPPAFLMGSIIIVQVVSSSMQQERRHLMGELVHRHAQDRIMEVTTSVELETFDDPEFHNRTQRINSNSHNTMQLAWGLTGIISSLVGVLSVSVALLAISPILIPLTLLVLVPVWVGASRRSQLFYRLMWQMTPHDRERFYVYGLLTGRNPAKEIRAFQSAGFLGDRYRRLSDRKIAELRRVSRRSALYSILSGLALGTVVVCLLLLVVWLTLRGTITLAEAGIAVAGVGVIGARLAGAGFAVSALSEGALFLDDYLEFLQLRPPEVPASTDPIEGFSSIEAQGLVFTYPTGTEPTIKGVSLTVHAGEVIALVGENGSGKTTLAKLLACLYSTQEGAIRWDGVNVVDDREAVRSRIAVIFQDFLHYHVTARENIGLGRWQAMDDEAAIEAAAMQAGCHNLLGQLREGYDTWLGPEFEGGTDLSVGQWQRIALARAFFRDAPFIILDEPTAALDARAEHELFRLIRTLLAGRTVLLISHRFSSVRSADRIYVMHDGEIVETGSHSELMALGGR